MTIHQVHALRSAECLARQRQQEHQQQRDEAQEELAARRWEPSFQMGAHIWDIISGAGDPLDFDGNISVGH